MVSAVKYISVGKKVIPLASEVPIRLDSSSTIRQNHLVLVYGQLYEEQKPHTPRESHWLEFQMKARRKQHGVSLRPTYKVPICVVAPACSCYLDPGAIQRFIDGFIQTRKPCRADWLKRRRSSGRMAT